MRKTAIPATGEAMPATTPLNCINRRHLLIGLAAASTAAAAAAVNPSTAKATSVQENSKLIALAAELPSVAETYHAANRAYRDMEKHWHASTPLAPDEITERGISDPWDKPPKQDEEWERFVTNRLMRRKGEEFPRRITTRSWKIYGDLLAARRRMRHAKKAGVVTDFLSVEKEAKRLKAFYNQVKTYEAEYREARAQYYADHERLYKLKSEALDALRQHIAAIMDQKDLTMEGLIIKAGAMGEWGRLDRFDKQVAGIMGDGTDWHGVIAASILRHAERGAV